jgi:SAM-dependent methyltransferase
LGASRDIRKQLREPKIEALTETVLYKCPNTNAEYRAYVKSQIQKSYNQSAEQLAAGPIWRTQHLAGLAAPFISSGTKLATVLCVGCRDARELDALETVCGMKAQGLDLFSDDPRIVVGDMHTMPFEDASFDVVYSCHSLEHALNPQAAASEFLRMLKPGGLLIIEVPIRFETTMVDCFDVGSIDKLIALFATRIETVLHQEEDPRVDVPGEGWVARLIARVS